MRESAETIGAEDNDFNSVYDKTWQARVGSTHSFSGDRTYWGRYLCLIEVTAPRLVLWCALIPKNPIKWGLVAKKGYAHVSQVEIRKASAEHLLKLSINGTPPPLSDGMVFSTGFRKSSLQAKRMFLFFADVCLANSRISSKLSGRRVSNQGFIVTTRIER